MHVVLLARKTLYTQPGGDTVQVEETASALRRCGHDAIHRFTAVPTPAPFSHCTSRVQPWETGGSDALF
jgi:hypothetical protein